MKQFETTFKTLDGRTVREEYSTAEDAIKAVEANGHGRVVKFYGQPNMPYCLPATVWSSTAMWTFGDDGWQGHAIHNGRGNPVNRTTPN
jgi:hypothetical protein